MEWVGDRIVLRRPIEADIDAIFEWYASNSEATHYMAWPTHETLED